MGSMSELNIMDNVLEDSTERSAETKGNIENSETLRDSVYKALHNYFLNLDGQAVSDVYQMVLTEVEAPLLETVLDYTHGNQTRAAEVLGLNRGTLRKKLKLYSLI
ncbi:MAG: DNA-binding transcriptional regulator Fis [Gammaproteobacteria bacterium]|nr:MAG: DNA-binding transcriptional regulator Fis [Gammaproteobacteria bacterium]